MRSADLTLLLCTANRVPEHTAERIRGHLLAVTSGRYPIVSVSQQRLDFGENVCVGPVGFSKYWAWWQALVGVRKITTRYTAMLDDDTLYSAEHFLGRPPSGRFYYESNYWLAQVGLDYYWRTADPRARGGMWGLIAETTLLRDNLETRYAKYPTDPWAPDYPGVIPKWWQEPGWGKGDREYGVAHEKAWRHDAPAPCVIFVHLRSMGRRMFAHYINRHGEHAKENCRTTLERFGDLPELRRYFWGEET